MCEVINFKSTLGYYPTLREAVKDGLLTGAKIVLIDVSPAVREYNLPRNTLLQENIDFESIAITCGRYTDDHLIGMVDAVADDNPAFLEDNPDAEINIVNLTTQSFDVASVIDELIEKALEVEGHNYHDDEIDDLVMLRNGKLAVCINPVKS